MKDLTLADYIRRTMEVLEEAKPEAVVEESKDQYKVYPEDDGYDTPKNPYSPV